MTKLIQLASHYQNQLNKSAAYGGKVFELPPNHQAGMIVPAGGSSCANCKWLNVTPDGLLCLNKYFIKWNGTSKLPVKDPSTYCSDWWEPK